MDQQRPNVRLRGTCGASPETVYDLLADLRTHVDWGGARQLPVFRLTGLSAPEGPATVGTVFESTGAIPMSRRRFEDRSTVTVATRPSTFEFVTEARARGAGREMAARLVHRYEIAPVSTGSRVTYTLTQEEVAQPMLRFAIPGIRAVTWSMAGFMFGQGFRNLLALAAARAARATTQARARA